MIKIMSCIKNAKFLGKSYNHTQLSNIATFRLKAVENYIKLKDRGLSELEAPN